jgi:hypothetical protein
VIEAAKRIFFMKISKNDNKYLKKIDAIT